MNREMDPAEIEAMIVWIKFQRSRGQNYARVARALAERGVSPWYAQPALSEGGYTDQEADAAERD